MNGPYRVIPGGVTAAKGFLASAVNAGIKRLKKPDVSLVASEGPATAAGVFTTNQVKAPPILISEARLRGGAAQAILLNSGCANCMTGDAGMRDAVRLGHAVAGLLRLPDDRVLMASTGLIGSRLPMRKMLRKMPELVASLRPEHHTAAALGILTTDLRPKEFAMERVIAGRTIRVGGMAKGAGMIAPSMATMLAVVTTDARVAAPVLRRLLREITENTFNRMTVDGDMSTNDCVLLLANGRSGVSAHPGSRALRELRGMLHQALEHLAIEIVRDGEGSTRLMHVEVIGARTDQEAQACARHVACSSLVKTMLAGGDPNVGRIAAAAGASAARFDPRRLDVFIEGHRLVSGGVVGRDALAAREWLRRPEVRVRIELHAGHGTGWMRTCDLTEEYVRINAHYAT